MTQQAPGWFTEAVGTSFDEGSVEVDGAQIHYLRWGDPSLPGLVLVHGGAAHAHWWSALAPHLTSSYHVVAVDLSGHGDSGWRDHYVARQWADEVMAVSRDAGVGAPPVLVGHSMGGFVSMVAAALHGDRLAGAIIVDSPVREPDPETQEGRKGRSFRNPKTYPTLDEALAHFRLIPSQPMEQHYLLDHIARHSLRQVQGGWNWKFDPRIFTNRESEPFHTYLTQARCRISVFHGQFSKLVTAEVNAYMNDLLGHHAPFVEIPQAHHHLVLDQPLAFLAALRAILADWEHTVPRYAPGLAQAR